MTEFATTRLNLFQGIDLQTCSAGETAPQDAGLGIGCRLHQAAGIDQRLPQACRIGEVAVMRQRKTAKSKV